MKRHRAPLGRHLAMAGRRLRNARRPGVTVLPAPANVNADWDSSTNSVVPADVREAAAAAEAATPVTTSV